MLKNQLYEAKKEDYKGQKIAAALYVVTAHLSDTDPLRQKLRELSIRMLEARVEERNEIGVRIMNLLRMGGFAKTISEKNIHILDAELRYYADPMYQDDRDPIATLFSADRDKGQFESKRTMYKEMSFISKKSKYLPETTDQRKEKKVHKTNRQHEILSLIREKKSANIKDISSLFPSVSEKTIQRELGVLVVEGKITRRGAKRWSVYMPVATPVATQ